MKVKIQNSNGQVFEIEFLDPRQSVYKLKKKIEVFSGVKEAEQTLKFKGQSLESEKTLGDYDIKEGDTIYLKTIIKVQHIDGRAFEFELLEPGETVLELKKRIEDVTNVPVTQQNLLYLGASLEDGEMTLAHCDIKGGCMINMVHRSEGGSIDYM